MGKTYARMLQRQGPTERAKIASDRRIFGYMRMCTVPTTKTARIDAPVASPALGCTPSTPHDRPAPLAALSKPSCEKDSVNVV